MAHRAERLKQRFNIVVFPLCFGIRCSAQLRLGFVVLAILAWLPILEKGWPVVGPHAVSTSPQPASA